MTRIKEGISFREQRGVTEEIDEGRGRERAEKSKKYSKNRKRKSNFGKDGFLSNIPFFVNKCFNRLGRSRPPFLPSPSHVMFVSALTPLMDTVEFLQMVSTHVPKYHVPEYQNTFIGFSPGYWPLFMG